MGLKVSVVLHDYHWIGYLTEGEALLAKDEIPRYGSGELYRYDPWDYLARRLLARCDTREDEVRRLMGLVEERWSAKKRIEAIEKEARGK